MLVSEYFKLNKTQEELDFVDVPCNGDLKAFIDPETFVARQDKWSQHCCDLGRNFFESFLNDIACGETEKAVNKVSRLREPKETHMGYCLSGFQGSCIGVIKACFIVDWICNHEKIVSGLITELSDLALFIPGVGMDLISDITVNVIKTALIEYTQKQCNLYSIPMKSTNQHIWNTEKECWENRAFELPFASGGYIIFVPKHVVTKKPLLDSEGFYNSTILTYLQSEEKRNNTSLVHFLKNGNKIVYKKDLRKQDKGKSIKERILDRCIKNPDLKEKYKATKRLEIRNKFDF